MTQSEGHRPTPEELEELFAQLGGEPESSQYLQDSALAALEKKKAHEAELNREAERQRVESQQFEH